MRPAVACAIALVAVAGCAAPSRPDDRSLRGRFRARRATFIALRDAVLAEPGLDTIRADSYSYVEPCDWPNGCSRRVDEPPTADVLARIGRMPRDRAQAYLDGLSATGAIAVIRESRARVVFWMHLAGIAPSGSTRSIVWSASPPPRLVADTGVVETAHGDQLAALEGDWYLEHEWN